MNTEETIEQEAEEYRLTYAFAKKNPEGFRTLAGLSVEEFIVEQALAQLKVSQVLRPVYRHWWAQHHTIFRIIAGLVNRRLDRRLAAAAAAA